MGVWLYEFTFELDYVVVDERINDWSEVEELDNEDPELVGQGVEVCHSFACGRCILKSPP